MPGPDTVENPMRSVPGLHPSWAGEAAASPSTEDFFMVSQTYVKGTARPTLYTVWLGGLSLFWRFFGRNLWVQWFTDTPLMASFLERCFQRGQMVWHLRLYNTLSFSKMEIIQLTYRLCGVYMTFAGMVTQLQIGQRSLQLGGTCCKNCRCLRGGKEVDTVNRCKWLQTFLWDSLATSLNGDFDSGLS